MDKGFGICTNCHERPSKHRSFDIKRTPQEQSLCCICHINDGGIPADWHPDCVKRYEELKKELFKIRFYWPAANEAGITEHPEQFVTQLGLKCFTYEAVGVADCSIMEVTGDKNKLEPYKAFITILSPN